jgi:hypothetical protein
LTKRSPERKMSPARALQSRPSNKEHHHTTIRSTISLSFGGLDLGPAKRMLSRGAQWASTAASPVAPAAP